jgi:ferredoxin-thioredoxin reductase catalytic chain
VNAPADRPEVSPDEVQKLFERLDTEAESAGYHLNPNREFTLGLIEGMLVNEKRFGYWACPCRLASGKKPEDLDIICPCDYRDADIAEHGSCYCALYVSQDIKDGKKKATRVPERRPRELRPADRMQEAPASSAAAQAGSSAASPALPDLGGLKYPLWRCRVCGYLCARDQPPEVCPICRAKKDRFERYA